VHQDSAGRARGAWSPDEDEVLRRTYHFESAPVIAAKLKRAVHGVRKRARMLGLLVTRNQWTQEDMTVLSEHFASMPNDQIARLTNHTPNQVRNKAGVLGLRKEPLPDETRELIWNMRDAPGVAEFFARQLNVREVVIQRSIQEMERRGGP
jgi:hypothetical protein